MSAHILDGREVAAAVRDEVAEWVAVLAGKGKVPGLATVLVGDDPASHVYVRSKRRLAAQVGINSLEYELDAAATQVEVEALVLSLNADPAVDGILVQLPLPKGLDDKRVTSLIDPNKDADGLHPYNLGLLALERAVLVPCTPQGVMRILSHYGIDPAGKRAVIVGRSFLVGRPLSMLLAAKGTDATVTTAHSRTPDIAAVAREADILVAAVGVPGLIGREAVKPGATVIDVGINRTEAGLVGDVDFDAVREVAGAITPVPGGVGPMTVAMLMRNTVAAAERSMG
ncbi:MAG: bifunctional methylenetetrahydrofolate dehydrogenase/methenyltetrahydrofolate cyclohydrolase FolD [Acidimicrobiia bacterium]|nr:bifunctional methylenetetrahydrofolate dehydrogenase/methenyltetrahydrofolate cyclohydrolase FolD [Acidimicrobiia bacterium]MDH3396861.1 bifunctional methylenetetrahydrofolate dehydrogenase/methenyltetrahydrofolate cyclohydrolase FolD [Acidimicrobiia bacterium]MDH5615382.1 bifunctional methylenetetrahydrofolate dehydrogenase/methenyltetrahydrofolate cyclohydrolase FolD [Acidimicrobiia bacterium]